MSGGRPDWQGWLALLDAPGLGSRGLAVLMRRCADPEAARAALLAEADRNGEPARPPAWLAAGGPLVAPEPLVAAVQRLGIEVLTLRDAGYPPQLAATPDPPPLLFVRGRIEDLALPAVAVVGSRHCSAAGARNSEEIGYVLVKMGYSVVSGLALGIDGAAHRGALDAGGPTVAVLGCGLDVDYPRGHSRLRQAIESRGAVVTEFPPGAQPLPPHFPRRNRVISGLARAVVVVEAGELSGALITVDFALQQGREVRVVPGPFGSPFSQGCARLLREGATPLADFRDLIDIEGRPEMPPAHAAPSAPPADRPRPAPIGLPLEVRRLPDWIDDDGSSVDDLVRRSGCPPGAVQQAMVQLELAGLIRALPGGRYAPRCGRPRRQTGVRKGSKQDG